MSPLGAAVIGLGVGRIHAVAYDALPEYELVAVCDTNPERLALAREQFGLAAYSDAAEMLRDERIEVVSVATPHPSHAPLAIAALESGRHVIVEKPMAVNLREADAMIECASFALALVMRITWI
ncbi:MAG: Gfo/Idh/MocA family oxidoreductase [Chloroflexi bacterium]|nr:Gfo/Idh/MocA family oxidoreductase [Chloroflexota bacterium]